MLQKESKKNTKTLPRSKKAAKRQEKPGKKGVVSRSEAFRKPEPAIDPNLSGPTLDVRSLTTIPSTPTTRSRTRGSTVYSNENQYSTPTERYANNPYQVDRVSRKHPYPILYHDEEHPRVNTPYFEGLDTGNVDEVEEIENADEKPDMTKLKGVIWPGMDLFDAASPEARRMRNQKKGSSVLAAMQANSQLVEPTEMIYFPSWELKKERFISGDVESSPPAVEIPRKKKKPGQSANPRTPLLELDLNSDMAYTSFENQGDFTNAEQARPTRSGSFLIPQPKGPMGVLPRGRKRYSNAMDCDAPNGYPSPIAKMCETPRGLKVEPQCFNDDEIATVNHTRAYGSLHNYGPYPNGSHSPFLCNTWDDGSTGLWAGGSLPKSRVQDHIDMSPEKENIAPALHGQVQRAAHPELCSPWPSNCSQRLGNDERRRLQRQMPPSLELFARQGFSSATSSGYQSTNPLGRPSHAAHSQNGLWYTALCSRQPRYQPVSLGTFDAALQSTIKHDRALSSGDETIDEGIDDREGPY